MKRRPPPFHRFRTLAGTPALGGFPAASPAKNSPHFSKSFLGYPKSRLAQDSREILLHWLNCSPLVLISLIGPCGSVGELYNLPTGHRGLFAGNHFASLFGGWAHRLTQFHIRTGVHSISAHILHLKTTGSQQIALFPPFCYPICGIVLWD